MDFIGLLDLDMECTEEGPLCPSARLQNTQTAACYCYGARYYVVVYIAFVLKSQSLRRVGASSRLHFFA